MNNHKKITPECTNNSGKNIKSDLVKVIDCENKRVNLKAAIQVFKTRMSQVDKNGKNTNYNYATIDDINIAIRSAALATMLFFKNEIAVGVRVDNHSIVSEANGITMKLKCSLVASNMFGGADEESESIELTYHKAIDFNNTSKMQNSLQRTSSALTYMEKKCKALLFGISDANDDDIDAFIIGSEERHYEQPTIAVADKIEGM